MGFWVIALAFLSFSETLHDFFLVITGIFIILTAVNKGSLIKPTEELIKE